MRLGVRVWLCLLSFSGLASAEEEAKAPGAPAEASPKAAGPLEVLVLGGGKAPEDAEAWMKRWKSAAEVMGNVVALAEGYPRVLQSDKVAGLKPGFHIVVLGFCPAAQRELPHKLIKSFFPGTYSKAVTGQPESCPEAMGEGASIAVEHTVRKDDLRLTAVQVDTKEDSSVYVVLFRDDTVLEHKSESYGFTESPWPTACSGRLKGTRSRVTTEGVCDIDAPECNNNVTHYRTRTSYAIEDGKLISASSEFDERRNGYCD